MRSKLPTTKPAPMALLGGLLGLVLMFSAVACQQQPADDKGGPVNENAADNENAAPNENAAGGDLVAGRSLYEERCTLCHGTPGAGEGSAPDLAGSAAATIETGVGGEDHPGDFSDLDDEDFEDLAAYLAEEAEDNENGVGGIEFPYAEVAFDHEEHTAALDCGSCHHNFTVACDSTECHADEWLGGVPRLKEAMHHPDGGCRACHIETTDDGAWRCSFCHTGLLKL